MLGIRQAKIIGILRESWNEDNARFLSIKDVCNELIGGDSPSYNTVATILKRLADQKKLESRENGNRLYYRFKNIEEEEINTMLRIFIHAFGVRGLSHLAKQSKDLTEKDFNELSSLLNED